MTAAPDPAGGKREDPLRLLAKRIAVSRDAFKRTTDATLAHLDHLIDRMALKR